MIQQTFFEARPEAPPATFVSGTRRDAGTRRQAAEKIKPHVSRMHQDLLNLLRGRGDRGATDEEIREALGLRADTARARRCELRDAGRLRDSGQRRPTSSGRLAAVWILDRATEAGGDGEPFEASGE
jgi:hypothetical protein